MPTISQNPQNDKLINIVSIVIPLAVAALIGIQVKLPLGDWTKILPHVIGFLNTTTAICLIYGFIAIKSKNINGHQTAMKLAFAQGGLFLILYILYHISNPSTPYGGTGWTKPVYYFFLITHIVLSIGVVRLVLYAIYQALTNQINAHKKTVKFAFPIWLYVSLTGVIVYLMISPFYV